MAWLFYGSLVVMVVAALRGLHVLGRVTQERDTYEWCNTQLEERVKTLYDTNQVLLAQNERLIDYHDASDQLEEPESWGNVFPTE